MQRYTAPLTVMATAVLAFLASSTAGADPNAATQTVDLAGASQILVVFGDETPAVRRQLPTTFDNGDWEQVDHLWAWSPRCPVTRLERDEVDAWSCPKDANTSVVQLTWHAPTAGGGPLPPGRLLAAPVELWREVPESLLPDWRPSAQGRVSLPTTSGQRLRLRFIAAGAGSDWHEVEAGGGPVESLRLRAADDATIRLLDDHGQPLGSGFVSFASPRATSEAHRAFSVADEHSVARVESLPADLSLVLIVNAKGRLPLRLETTSTDLPREIRLLAGCSVTGIVTDTEARPVPGASVRAQGYAEGGGGPLVEARAESDGEGRFQVGPLPARSTVLSLTAAGMVRSLVRLDLSECRDRWDAGPLRLGAASQLVISLTDDLGQPLSEAVVETANGESTASDRRGQAVLREVAGDAGLELRITAPGHLSRAYNVLPPLPAILALQLERAVTVHGRFLSPEGTPTPSAVVEIRRASHFSERPVAADGTFTLDLEPQSGYELRFHSPSTAEVVHRFAPQPAGSAIDLGDLLAPPGWAVVGRVVDGDTGEAVPGATVSTLRNGSAGGRVVAWAFGRRAAARSDSDGDFRLSGLAPGPAAVRFEAHGFAPVVVDVLPSGDDLEVELEEISLSSGATLQVTGDFEDGSVARVDWRGEWQERDMIVASFVAGEARLRHVPPGDAIVTVVENRRQSCERRLVVPPDGDLEVDCAEAAVEVRGSVVAAGRPAGSGTLVWYSDTAGDTLILNRRSPLGVTDSRIYGAGRPQVDVAVGPDGTFTTAELSPGHWEVHWNPLGGGTSRPRAVDLTDAPEIELQLEFASAELLGTVLDGDGAPVAEARVVDLDGRSTARTAEDGSFRLVDLNAGRHRVHATKGGRRSRIEVVEVEPDRTPEQLLLTLEATADPALRVSVAIDDRPAAGGFVMIESEGTGLRILTLDSAGHAALELPPPLPARLRAAAFVDGRLALGGWLATETALQRGVDLVVEEGGALEIEASAEGEVSIQAPGGWNLSAIYRHLGIRLAGSASAPLRLAGLPPGAYHLGLGDSSRTVHVEARRTVEVRFTR